MFLAMATYDKLLGLEGPTIHSQIWMIGEFTEAPTKLEKLPVTIFPNKQIQGYVDSAFVIMFTLELLIRVTLQKLTFFRDYANWFDAGHAFFGPCPTDWWLGTRATIPYVRVQ